MKRLGVLMAVVMGVMLLFTGVAVAIQGVCSNCHTMHNSQNGVGEVQTYEDGTITTGVETPQAQLLKADCIACHAGDTGKTNSFNAPIVVHTTEPGGQGGGKTLAGGDFYWVAEGLGGGTYGDTYGHNVADIADMDQEINSYKPPGWDPNATPGVLDDGTINGGENDWSKQLTCAGKYGCHGNHSAEDQMGGIRGAHHGNVGGTSTKAENPDSVGKSFRFLGGINGLEDSEWQWNESSSVHNEYYGIDTPSGRNQTNTNYANKRTISYFCAECHGYFHSRIDDNTQGSPWLRHPTDIKLPSSGEYQYYNLDGGKQYSVEAPVARSSVPDSSSSTVTPGEDIVMCLSCHRAHGSDQPDLLRWNYADMQAGSGTSDTGCFTCHTTKNGD